MKCYYYICFQQLKNINSAEMLRFIKLKCFTQPTYCMNCFSVYFQHLLLCFQFQGSVLFAISKLRIKIFLVSFANGFLINQSKFYWTSSRWNDFIFVYSCENLSRFWIPAKSPFNLIVSSLAKGKKMYILKKVWGKIM